MEFWNNGQTVMTTRRQYDSANRLRATETTAQGSRVASFTYAYNLAGQRTNVTLGPDNSQWRHQYDFLGQLTNGQKAWRDGTPVAGQQFRYFFDDIGNRTSTQAGGDTNGQDLRAARYTNHLLNELTSREVPGAADVTGRAHASATVTVNGQGVSRKGEYYRHELALNNTLAPIYQPVTNQATLAGATGTSTGTILLPGTPQPFWHDPDGNLLSDGVWTNRWDAENRLVEMQTTAAAVPAGVPAQKLVFTYDPLGRRISKTVFNWITGDWSLITNHRFLYDGWNLVAVLASDLSPLLSFTWGLDLSGTEQGAGGVGGLLAVTVHTGTNAGTYFPAYDGNGNVVALVNATNAAPAAQYEYGPFHELLRATGPLARQNPCLAASKYHDWETGVYYYGYRYEAPSTGRWLSRDPMGERGGLNPYGFAVNSPANYIDKDGQIVWVFLAAGAIYFGTEVFANAPGPGDPTTSGLTGDNVLAFMDLGILVSAKLSQLLTKCLCKPVCSRLVPAGGLSVHERLGGHALARHVKNGATSAQIEAALASRLAADASIPAASAFLSRSVAEKAITEALESNQAAVCAWLSGRAGRLVLTHRASESVGLVLARGTTTVTTSRTLVVVLDRLPPQAPLCFIIKTAYPK